MTQAAPEGAYQDVVTIFIARTSVELAAIRAAFDHTEIPLFARPMGLPSALAIGQAPDDQFELQVPEVHVDAALHILKPFGASVPRIGHNKPIQLAPSPEEYQADLESERRWRIQLALLFLIPMLPPFNYLVSLINARRWREINDELATPTKAPNYVLAVSIVGIGISLVLWFLGRT